MTRLIFCKKPMGILTIVMVLFVFSPVFSDEKEQEAEEPASEVQEIASQQEQENEEVSPQFVVFRVEGNTEPQSLSWILSAVNKRRNGDNSKAKITFFANGLNLQNSRKVLRKAYRKGHEIGNHTFSGFVDTVGERIDARFLDEAAWFEEIHQNDSLLRANLRIPKKRLVGFLAPRLEYNEGAFRAIRRQQNIIYDASIQEADFVAPFDLEHGSRTDSLWAQTRRNEGFRTAGKHKGLWVIPTLQWIVPHDSLAATYGFEAGLRQRSFAADNTFDTISGRTTGTDLRLIGTSAIGGFDMKANEAAATIKHSFHGAMEAGVPFSFPITAFLYVAKNDRSAVFAGNHRERRKMIEGVMDYMLSFENVRFVRGKDLIQKIKATQGIETEDYDYYEEMSDKELMKLEISEELEEVEETIEETIEVVQNPEENQEETVETETLNKEETNEESNETVENTEEVKEEVQNEND